MSELPWMYMRKRSMRENDMRNHQTLSPQATNPLLTSSNPSPTLFAQPSNVASRLTSSTSSLDRLPGSQIGLECRITWTHEGVNVIERCECGSGKVLLPDPRDRVMIDVGKVRSRSSIRAQGFLLALKKCGNKGTYLKSMKQFIKSTRLFTEITFHLSQLLSNCNSDISIKDSSLPLPILQNRRRHGPIFKWK
jgi:hypothetical protein